MKLRFSVLSLTELSSAGLLKTSDASSSIREILRPPKAVECADTGISRKLNTELLSWAYDAAASRIYNAKISFFVI